MSDTLLIVQGYERANERLERHWPYYEIAGCPIMGVGRAGGRTKWPTDFYVRDLNYRRESSGGDSYVRGDNLPRLLVECFKLGLEVGAFSRFCVIENDAIFTKLLPRLDPGLWSINAAGRQDGFLSGALHTPWYADRQTAEMIVEYGERMLEIGLLERGYPDRFLSLMCDLYRIPVRPFPGFSCNQINTPHLLSEARKAIQSGACYVHGIKTAEQLEAVTRVGGKNFG